MLMKNLLFCFLLLAQIKVFAQTKKFEGEIHYLNLYQFAVKGIDTMAILKDFGNSSTYYYKNGSYKWTFEECKMKEEYYSAITGKTFDRYEHSDTLFFQKNSEGDTLLRYEIQENADTICGYVCNRLNVLIGNKNDKEALLMRFIFYVPELIVDPEKFKEFGGYCNYEVYKITKSAFLRIEMLNSYWPFKLRMEATKVIPRSLSEKEVSMPENSIKKE